MIEKFRWIAAGVALVVGVDAWAGFCPPGADLLQSTGPDTFVLTCSDATGADGCWEPPSGACQFSNTVTVTVDGTVIDSVTYPGTGDPSVCSSSWPLIGHTFTAGVTHHVVETTTAPVVSDDFTVTVLPGPACDADFDQVFDTVDNCLGVANTDQKDTDLDGDGDACDDDDDDDGCLDRGDDDPGEGDMVIGHRLLINCPQSSANVYGWAGGDTDGDGLPHCADDDDDGDGIPDDRDECPVHAAKLGPFACEYPPVTCPFQVWWDVCMFGACNELLVRWTSVVNPDPTQILFTEIDIVGQALVLSPQDGMTLDDMRSVLLGERYEETSFALEVWTAGRSGEAVAHLATIGTYDAARVEALAGAGNALVLGFDEKGVLATIQQMSH